MREFGKIKSNHYMKKHLLGLMAILSILGACQKYEAASISEPITLHATIEDEDATKTVMDENNNILWSENDQIVAFMKSSYGHKYQVKPSFVGKSYADFSMVSSGNGNDLSAGNEWEHNVIYYPYSEDIECLKSGVNYELEVNLPSEQVYVPDSFANGSMAMVAVSESNNITFKNILGGMKLQLKGTQKVKSITLQGKNNEKLSGAAIVTAYTDETKPAITMTSGASKSVTLNCGEGIQLNESNATEFIIALPPVLFTSGFTLTITDVENRIYTIETYNPNTVLRSSLLTMPAVTLVNNEDDTDKDDGNVPVGTVNLNYNSMTVAAKMNIDIVASVGPVDATDKSLIWSSSSPTLAVVNQSGTVTTIGAGEVTITAISKSGVYASCYIEIVDQATPIEYKVDGISYGYGIAMGDVVWAPVNCGYEAPEFDEDGNIINNGYPWGKLYQWGRKYGQGYSTKYESVEPDIVEGPISHQAGQSSTNANVFYTSSKKFYYDWISPSDDALWNCGSEIEPQKNKKNDPCPEGWRVPTYKEINSLKYNSINMLRMENGVKGRYFTGPFTASVPGVPSVFLPVAGYRLATSNVYARESYGLYWTSNPCTTKAYYLFIDEDRAFMHNYDDRGDAHSVRCVQE